MRIILTTMIVMLAHVTIATAQTGADALNNARTKLVQRVDSEMPGWRHRVVEPVYPSKNVIIDQWELGDIAIKVAITQYDSVESAVAAFQDFEAHLRVEESAAAKRGKKDFHLIKEDVPFLGDKAFVWGVRRSDAVCFRKGKFLAVVSVARPEDSTGPFFAKTFARKAADVLDLP